MTKEEKSAYDKVYRKAHREKRDSQNKAWYVRNKPEKNAQSKRNYEANKEAIIARQKAYNKTHREEINKNRKLRLSVDFNYRLAQNLRARLNHVLRGRAKTGSAVRDLGCSIEFLKAYLEERFKPEMTWDGYGEWEIDHIKPLSKFDLTDREQLLQACHYTNLQPLWKFENISKGDK